MIQPPPQAVIFDLDGTLCYLNGDFVKLLTRIVHQHTGISDSEKLLRCWNQSLLEPGPSSARIALHLTFTKLGHPQSEITIENIAESLNHEYSSHTVLMPHASDILKKLSTTFTLGLLSNGPSDMQRRVIEALGIDSFFRAIVVSGDQDVGVRKPHASIFHLISQRLGVNPTHCIMIGDNQAADIDGASGVGMRGVLVDSSCRDGSYLQSLPEILSSSH